MDGIGVLIVEDKDVVETSTRLNRETTSLVRIRLENFAFGEHRGEDFMTSRFEGWRDASSTESQSEVRQFWWNGGSCILDPGGRGR